MKLKMLLMATALLLPMSSVFAETTDDYVVGLKKGASIGNTEAQKELDQFQELCKKANTGDAQAQYDLGMFYYNKAEKYYKTVFSHNDDYEQKLQEWLGKAANQGNEKAQHELIEYYKKILKKIDYRFSSSEEQARVSRYNKKLEEWLLKAANKGNANDQYELALYYINNSDSSVHNKAVVWMTKAADQDLTQAQIDLGQWYFKGKDGVEKNYNKAKVVFQKLADQGNVEGLYYLGLCYHLGYGVNKSEEKAVKLYETAADKGNIESATYLSQLYFKGIDQIIPRDRNKFKQYYDQACSEDQFDACLELKGSIMDECSSIYGADSILDPNSDIDPICRALFAPVLRIINGFVK